MKIYKEIDICEMKTKFDLKKTVILKFNNVLNYILYNTFKLCLSYFFDASFAFLGLRRCLIGIETFGLGDSVTNTKF